MTDKEKSYFLTGAGVTYFVMLFVISQMFEVTHKQSMILMAPFYILPTSLLLYGFIGIERKHKVIISVSISTFLYIVAYLQKYIL